jgi:hypothetical protein
MTERKKPVSTPGKPGLAQRIGAQPLWVRAFLFVAVISGFQVRYMYLSGARR